MDVLDNTGTVTPQKGAQFSNSGTKMATEQRVNVMPRIVWPSILAALTFATPATASDAPARTFTAKGIACHHAATIGRLTQLAVDGNRKVFTAYALVETLHHHECVELSAGTSITIEAADPSNLAICVLPDSEIDCWWMSPEMVDGFLRDALSKQ
jgi:hypothetical protein